MPLTIASTAAVPPPTLRSAGNSICLLGDAVEEAAIIVIRGRRRSQQGQRGCCASAATSPRNWASVFSRRFLAGPRIMSGRSGSLPNAGHSGCSSRDGAKENLYRFSFWRGCGMERHWHRLADEFGGAASGLDGVISNVFTASGAGSETLGS